MIKSAVILKFLKTNRYVLYPKLIVKDSGSYAIPPYISEFDLSIEELLDKVLYVIEFSKEGSEPKEDYKIRQKEFFKGIGVKNMKELHDDSITLSVYIRDGFINFTSWENQGQKKGFVIPEEDFSIKLPFNSPREELIKALELTLLKCK